MPIASTEEQLAITASIREWAKRAATIDVVRAQEPFGGAGKSADTRAAAERWASLAELGVFAVGLPAAAGGSGSTSDLAAVLAQLTDSLVPGPVLPTLLAAQALARAAAPQTTPALLPHIADGSASVAVALDGASVQAGSLTAQEGNDGSLLLVGQTGPLLGGGSTTHLFIGAPGNRWCLLPAGAPGVDLTARAPADFSRSLADVTLTDVRVPAGQVLAGIGTDDVHDIAAALAAVEAAAVASWCSRTAAEYAAIRHQFGRPIGAFQAVKHLCAQLACRAETASALAADAARAIDEAPGELPLAAAAAAAYNLDAAVDNAKDCIQVLGGIGFTWEHDAHLYLRRALSVRQLLGGASLWRDRAAVLAAAGARRHLTVTDPDGPAGDSPAGDSAAGDGAAGDSAAGGELAASRAAAADVARRVAALPADEQRTALAEAGYVAPDWPAPHGLGATPAQRLVIDDELSRAGISRPDLVVGGWALPAIFGHGTAEQQERFAAATLRGEITWCQLFSEPEAGSDLASLRTRAQRVDPAGKTGGGWLLTGQKVWTSVARQAQWAICLARTDPDAPKHKGLTYFLVAMDTPGIDIRPLREMTGREMFNQVFLDEVFVPDDCVVGTPGEGWRVARTTLASERVAMGTGSSVGEAVEQLLAAATASGATADPVVRQRLGALVAQGMAVSLLDHQAVLAQLRGADPGPLAAVRKLVGVAHRQAAAEAALELTGSSGAAANPALQEFLLTRCLSIAGGTTQILLSVVGERLLGLPREETR